MGSVKHLKQHQYSIPDGQEPLGQTPLIVRFYESDHETVKAIGKAGCPFVHAVI